VLARALASGISQGTELLLYRGEGPTSFDPSLDAPGAPTYPRRYGYAWVGEVVAAGDDAGVAPGSRIFALAPHGDWHLLDASAVRVLDPHIPAARAVLAANLETAVTCIWDSGCSIGDQVVVLGGGVVGLLVGWLSASAGARVLLVEPSARRRAAAECLDLRAVGPGVDPRADADVVFEATGDPAVLARAIAHARPEGTIVVASFYGARAAPVPLGAEFHRRRLTLRASQVSSIPPSMSARWSLQRRFELVTSLLHESVLDALLDPVVAFDDAPAAYARLREAPGDALQVVFGYA
jgi:2-desacetyl-2-hydroxyethyl bacteriochlorophyllide A dehydrogenase